jgi:hypothetical protein
MMVENPAWTEVSIMRRMYGVEMQAPVGKLPGFYAQVIHKIGDNVNVFDRDQQLLIVESEEQRAKLTEILEKAKMLGETFELLLLPVESEFQDITDFGFTSQDGNPYLYADHVSVFRLNAGTEEDRWAALEQMKEHVLVSIPSSDGSPTLIIDKNEKELMEGIARAYRVSMQWVDLD